MLYEYSEHFIMPLSHDEVVHLKGSLLQQDARRRLAEARQPAPAARVHVHPPRQEAAVHGHRARAVDRVESRHEPRLAFASTSPIAPRSGDSSRDSATLYRHEPALWRDDASWEGFAWIDVADRENSVVSYARRADDGRTPSSCSTSRPCRASAIASACRSAGRYERLLSTDDRAVGRKRLRSKSPVPSPIHVPFHGHPQSIEVSLPPLGALVLAPVRAHESRRERTTDVRRRRRSTSSRRVVGIIDEYVDQAGAKRA